MLHGFLEIVGYWVSFFVAGIIEDYFQRVGGALVELAEFEPGEALGVFEHGAEGVHAFDGFGEAIEIAFGLLGDF